MPSGQNSREQEHSIYPNSKFTVYFSMKNAKNYGDKNVSTLFRSWNEHNFKYVLSNEST